MKNWNITENNHIYSALFAHTRVPRAIRSANKSREALPIFFQMFGCATARFALLLEASLVTLVDFVVVVGHAIFIIMALGVIAKIAFRFLRRFCTLPTFWVFDQSSTIHRASSSANVCWTILHFPSMAMEFHRAFMVLCAIIALLFVVVREKLLLGHFASST